VRGASVEPLIAAMASVTDGSSSTYHASDGAAYERFLGRWSRLLAAPFAQFAALPEAGELLDVGCGTGSLAFLLAERQRHGQVSGIDIAFPYIAFARSRSGAVGPQFTIGDACRLPYSDGGFAAALAQLSLNFVPDAAAAAREMRRVVRPSGVVAATVWDFRGGLVFQRLFWDTAAGLDAGAGAARRSADAVAWGRARRGRTRINHDPHGIRRFRGLLGASPWWARTGWQLCRQPSTRAPHTNRGAGARGVSIRGARRSSLADRYSVGGARGGTVISPLRRQSN